MKLETESKEFLTAFITSMEKKGFSKEEIEDHYHLLRVEEGAMVDAAFNEGLHKQATQRNALMLAKKVAPHARKMKTVKQLRKGPSKGLLAGLGLAGIPASIAGMSGALTGTNPFTALGVGSKSGPDALNIRAPKGVGFNDNGRMQLGSNTSLEGSLRYKQILSGIDKRRQEVEQQMATAGEGLEGTMARRRAQDALAQLNQDRSAVEGKYNNLASQWGKDLGASRDNLSRQQQNIEQALSRNRGRSDSLNRYMNKTEGSLFSNLWHKMPGVNPENKARRLLDERNRLQQQLVQSRLASDSFRTMSLSNANNIYSNMGRRRLSPARRDQILGFYQ